MSAAEAMAASRGIPTAPARADCHADDPRAAPTITLKCSVLIESIVAQGIATPADTGCSHGVGP